MKESDLNRKEGRRSKRMERERRGGRSARRDRKDKENSNECMSDEGWNEQRREEKKGQDRKEGGVKNKTGGKQE